ncbi:MAG: hypothetical protein BGO49_24595 [Planctomycetales bacterium 71-10]|nr:MAG: hypothetical protein BGO49_24595 [Planctomycetales bacterium 71-10]
MTTSQKTLEDLARIKALFQLRAITAAMEIPAPESVDCPTCCDHHDPDAIPLPCQTGDGE